MNRRDLAMFPAMSPTVGLICASATRMDQFYGLTVECKIAGAVTAGD
jgi:hypothetical protein